MSFMLLYALRSTYLIFMWNKTAMHSFTELEKAKLSIEECSTI